MFYLVSYDIPDDKRRLRVAGILEDYGTRVQYSVFECLLEKDVMDAMKKRLEVVANVAEDSIRFYMLCDVCQGKIEILGTGETTKDSEVFIV